MALSRRVTWAFLVASVVLLAGAGVLVLDRCRVEREGRYEWQCWNPFKGEHELVGLFGEAVREFQEAKGRPPTDAEMEQMFNALQRELREDLPSQDVIRGRVVKLAALLELRTRTRTESGTEVDCVVLTTVYLNKYSMGDYRVTKKELAAVKRALRELGYKC